MSSEIAGSPKVEFVDFLGRAATEKAAEPPKSHHRSDRPDCLPVSGLRFGSSRNCEKVVRDPSFFRFFSQKPIGAQSRSRVSTSWNEASETRKCYRPPHARGRRLGRGRARAHVASTCDAASLKIFDIFLICFVKVDKPGPGFAAIDRSEVGDVEAFSVVERSTTRLLPTPRARGHRADLACASPTGTRVLCHEARARCDRTAMCDRDERRHNPLAREMAGTYMSM